MKSPPSSCRLWRRIGTAGAGALRQQYDFFSTVNSQALCRCILYKNVIDIKDFYLINRSGQ
jgi:hypothetical protein